MNDVKKEKNILTPKLTTGGAPEKEPASISAKKPNVFHYHDYVQFLKDWLEYQKQNHKGFSLRKLSASCRLSIGYLPMILSNQRPLSLEALNKLAPALKLTKSEMQFFKSIHLLGTTASQNQRLECLNQMKRCGEYRSFYPNESEIHRYLTKWYYFTIREMAADPEFQLDALWAQGRLREHVPLAEIKEALTFLVDNKYIIKNEFGHVVPPEKHLTCEGGIYKVALSEYHRQLLVFAEKSIENATSSERHLIGHTFAVSEKKFDQIRLLMKDVITQIQSITDEPDSDTKDSVYHIEMALFPLTRSKDKK